MGEPPGILNYRSPGSGGPPPLPPPRRGLAVFFGILGGVIVSGIVWPLAFWSQSGAAILVALVVLVAGKLTSSIVLIVRSNRWRFHAIGLLISIALGGIIFFFSCAAGITAGLGR